MKEMEKLHFKMVPMTAAELYSQSLLLLILLQSLNVKVTS